jgi:hypothetical protein
MDIKDEFSTDLKDIKEVLDDVPSLNKRTYRIR